MSSNLETEKHRRRLKPIARPTCCISGCGLTLLLLFIIAVHITRGNRPTHIDIPSPPIPANNAFDDFIAAAQLTKLATHKNPLDVSNPTAVSQSPEAFALAANDLEPAMSKLRDGLTKECQVPPTRIGEISTSMAQIRELSRALGCVVQDKINKHEYYRAACTMLDGEEMATMLEHKSSVLTALSCTAIEAL